MIATVMECSSGDVSICLKICLIYGPNPYLTNILNRVLIKKK